MGNVTHTRGPWRYYADLPSVEPNWHTITTDSKMRVIANIHIEPGNAMDTANAGVLTAAPELLHAVKVAREVFNSRIDEEHCLAGPVNWADLMRAMDAAIAKAEGGAA